MQEEINTFKGVTRIVRHAFEFAKTYGRRRVCMADKSNAMTHGHALRQRVFREVLGVGVLGVGGSPQYFFLSCFIMSNLAVSATAITAMTPAWTGSVTTRSAASGTLPAMFSEMT